MTELTISWKDGDWKRSLRILKKSRVADVERAVEALPPRTKKLLVIGLFRVAEELERK